MMSFGPIGGSQEKEPLNNNFVPTPFLEVSELNNFKIPDRDFITEHPQPKKITTKQYKENRKKCKEIRSSLPKIETDNSELKEKYNPDDFSIK